MLFSSSAVKYLPLILDILGYHENHGLRIHPISKQTNKQLQVNFFFAPENTKQEVLAILHLCNVLTIISPHVQPVIQNQNSTRTKPCTYNRVTEVLTQLILHIKSLYCQIQLR